MWDYTTVQTMEFTPQQAEQFTNLSRDMLRDWRRRGLLQDIGSQSKTGRWTYALGDLIALAAAKTIESLGVDLYRALEIGSKARAGIADWARSKPLSENISKCPFLACWPIETGKKLTRYGVREGEVEMLLVDDLNAIPKFAGFGAIVIDLRKVAFELPEALRELLVASSDARFTNTQSASKSVAE